MMCSGLCLESKNMQHNGGLLMESNQEVLWWEVLVRRRKVLKRSLEVSQLTRVPSQYEKINFNSKKIIQSHSVFHLLRPGCE